MRWDFDELISRDAIGKAPMRSENCELILKDASRLLCTREYLNKFKIQQTKPNIT